MQQKFVVLVILNFLISLSAYAGERYEFYNGVRGLGMGGASVAAVNDETSLLINPAALGKLRNYFLTVIDPEVDVGVETLPMVDLDVMKFMNPQKVLDEAVLNPGTRFHQRAQIFPSFVVTNFGFGFYGKYSTDAYTDNPATQFTYEYRNDLAFVMGFNFRMFDGRIKMGVNVRGVNRTESQRTDIPIATTGLDLETLISGTTVANEGFGVGSDAGLILTAPWALLPTLAVVYRDIGTTSYDINKGMFLTTSDRPNRTPETIDAGFSISPIIGKKARMVITADYVDVTDKVEPATDEASDEIMRRIHGGIEINFSDTFFIRGGMNQGYWTAGVEVAMNNTQLQFATYGEEVGDVVPTGSAAAYDAKEDRRYVFKYAFRF